jgi:hypothetical protein
MAQTEGIRLNLNKPRPLARSIYWAEQFLNQMGGDFSLTEITETAATLVNTSSCAGMCGNRDTCDAVERAINVAIKVFDNNLSADLSSCGHDDSNVCQLEVYFK